MKLSRLLCHLNIKFAFNGASRTSAIFFPYVLLSVLLFVLLPLLFTLSIICGGGIDRPFPRTPECFTQRNPADGYLHIACSHDIPLFLTLPFPQSNRVSLQLSVSLSLSLCLYDRPSGWPPPQETPSSNILV